MKSSNIIYVLLITLVLIECVRAQVTIGVSPPVLDLGEVEKGKTKIARFDVITSSENVIMTRLESVPGNPDFFNSGSYVNYLYNYSDEDSKTWIEFLSNPVDLHPTSIQSLGMKNFNEINFLLNIPQSAESGYHSVMVTLDPRAVKQAIKQVTIKTIVPLTIIFQVPGNVLRQGKIYDIALSGFDDNTAYLNVFFQNTGNVTLLVKAGEMNMFDAQNNYLGKVIINGDYIKPGENKIFTSAWSINKSYIPGSYRIEAKILYPGGSTEKTAYIQLYKKPSAPATSHAVEGGEMAACQYQYGG